MDSLFIGGPADGQTIKTGGQAFFTHKNVEYRRADFEAGESLTSVYVASSMVGEEDDPSEVALHALLHGYAKNKQQEVRPDKIARWEVDFGPEMVEWRLDREPERKRSSEEQLKLDILQKTRIQKDHAMDTMVFHYPEGIRWTRVFRMDEYARHGYTALMEIFISEVADRILHEEEQKRRPEYITSDEFKIFKIMMDPRSREAIPPKSSPTGRYDYNKHDKTKDHGNARYRKR